MGGGGLFLFLGQATYGIHVLYTLAATLKCGFHVFYHGEMYRRVKVPALLVLGHVLIYCGINNQG